MGIKGKILNLLTQKDRIRTTAVAKLENVSRQYAHRIINELVQEGKIIKKGATRSAYYVSAEPIFSKRYVNEKLTEGRVLNDVRSNLEAYGRLKENVQDILDYAFSEIMNNAIEHSHSQYIDATVKKERKNLSFLIRDYGVGVFNNVKKKLKLQKDLEAIQDILKGKTTTDPKSHSGEGIFFTSKAADLFVLASFGHKLRIDNKIDDVFIEETERPIKGTEVEFAISTESNRELIDVFKRYQTDEATLGFDKTEIHVKLYTLDIRYISRSEARRLLRGLEKFNKIILDYDKVKVIGQAFVDEIYRVFRRKHPKIEIGSINMNDSVKFMASRAAK